MSQQKLETWDDGKLVETEIRDMPDDPLADAKAVLMQSLDPEKPSPVTEKRLDAIEELLAAQLR